MIDRAGIGRHIYHPYTTGFARFAVRHERTTEAKIRTAQHCRADSSRAHGKGRTVHFHPDKTFAVRRRTAKVFVVRNM
jgi:hypothetical protein